MEEIRHYYGGTWNWFKRPNRSKPSGYDTWNYKDEGAYLIVVKGTVNGQPFTVEGKGHGNSDTGKVKGVWTCPSAKLPLSWVALAGTLGFGYKCFAKFQDGVPGHYYQECMPDGYTQERVIRFEGDGTINSYQEVYIEKGVIVNKVTLQAEGFQPNSPVLNDGIACPLPSTETVIPLDDGLKSLVHHLFPRKENPKSYVIATQTTVTRPINNTSDEDEDLKPPLIPPLQHFCNDIMRVREEKRVTTDHAVIEASMQVYKNNNFLVQEKRSDFEHVYFESGTYDGERYGMLSEYEIIEEPGVDFFKRVRDENRQ